ncbi:unnamed protein product [Clonostachys rosea f. rosea IK726]|uniref:Uncharacterized protein n=2 Tax=Bionectria ochroleuca TaxID=29856 RepID=A0A0B7KIR4_BIOOC|nr:unnamed protein product [Clonostachys rosea f. rosea IK726]
MAGFKYLNKLQGQRILILGGSSGIGFAVAQAAVEHGAVVYISSSKQTRLDDAVTWLQTFAKEVGLPSDNIFSKTCDLSNPETLESNITELLDFATVNGKLNHVVLTAGDALNLPVLKDVTLAQLHQASSVRYYSAIFLAKLLPKYVVSHSSSSLTFSSGSKSKRPDPNWSIISSLGGALEGAVRGFAMDLKPIRVNLIELGIVETEFLEHIPEQVRGPLLEKSAKANLLGKVGAPEDVAEAYLYCLKDSFVTGTTIVTDGGMLVGGSE